MLWITFAWTLVSVYQFVSGSMTLYRFGCEAEAFDATAILTGSVFTGVLAGLLGGTVVVFLWEKWLRSKNYRNAIFSIFWSFSIIYFMVAIPGNLLMFSDPEAGTFFSQQNLTSAIQHVFAWDQLIGFAFWFFVVLITLIVLQVNDKYGPGVFMSFLLGKYFIPRKEERIFMFLDLRSSTTIAESLGEEKYFRFIRKVFEDVTPPILNARGEIYQYVGDEIVISWPLSIGLKHNNCINCFFDIQNLLKHKKSNYRLVFDGLYPEFKAGLHYGHVMAGEVGVVKKDIVFSGDVLNTTARIQSRCNDFGVNLLLSGDILERLTWKNKIYHPKRLGEILLKGKQEKVVLFGI